MRFIMRSTFRNNFDLFAFGIETESTIVNGRLARRYLVRHTSRCRGHDNQCTLTEALQLPWQLSILRTRRLLQNKIGPRHAYGIQ